MTKIITTLIKQFTNLVDTAITSLIVEGNTAVINGVIIELPTEYDRYTTWRTIKAQLTTEFAQDPAIAFGEPKKEVIADPFIDTVESSIPTDIRIKFDPSNDFSDEEVQGWIDASEAFGGTEEPEMPNPFTCTPEEAAAYLAAVDTPLTPEEQAADDELFNRIMRENGLPEETTVVEEVEETEKPQPWWMDDSQLCEEPQTPEEQAAADELFNRIMRENGLPEETTVVEEVVETEAKPFVPELAPWLRAEYDPENQFSDNEIREFIQAHHEVIHAPEVEFTVELSNGYELSYSDGVCGITDETGEYIFDSESVFEGEEYNPSNVSEVEHNGVTLVIPTSFTSHFTQETPEQIIIPVANTVEGFKVEAQMRQRGEWIVGVHITSDRV